MNILLLMIPLSLLLLGAAIWAFVWAVRRGQFEDLDTPALDILREDAGERAVRKRAEAEAAAAHDDDAEVPAATPDGPGADGLDHRGPESGRAD